MDIIKTGHLIAERRTALGLTQMDLAQQLHITDKAVSKWERGKSLPDVALLGQLAAALRVSVVELLNGELKNTSRSSFLREETPPPATEDYARALTICPDAGTELAVSPYLFGCNLEHTRSCIYNGLSAQLLHNRKFVGKPSVGCGCAAEWYPIGERAVFRLAPDIAYTRHAKHGYHMQRSHECNALTVTAPDTAAAGIGQHGLCLQKGKTYRFAAVVRTLAPVTLQAALTARGGGRAYAQQTLCADAADWTRYEVTLTAEADDPDADIRITFAGAGSITFGALSLLPEDNFHGMRPDVIHLLKEMGIRMLRWPGGNFAGEYCWFDGLLPVDMRAPFESYLGIETQPHSLGYDFHEIGIDEFIALCRAVGAQPFITINPCWNTPEENAAWVEYCNGDSTTEYGRLRVQRGHAEPYNVQFWSLGNEAGYGHMEGDNTPAGYCRIALENARKMLEVSPHLSLCSSGPYPNPDWAQLSARPLADTVPLVSLHHYSHWPDFSDPARRPQEYNTCIAGVSAMREEIRRLRSMIDPRTRISFDEWNVWYAWYRPTCVTDGIHAALALHMFMEEADRCGVALGCHFEAINEGLIDVRPDNAALTAQGQVFAAMKQHIGGRLCHAAPDVTVTADTDGNYTATVINAAFDTEKSVEFSAFGTCTQATLYSSDTVLPPSRFAEQNVLAEACTGRLQLPPHSFALLRFEKE